MNGIFEFLAEPVVGSVIGILGILIGAIFAISFYYKSKIVSKPCYSIDSIKLIDLSLGEIPNSVAINYNGETIKRLNKTTIRFWNAGKKPITKADLSPEYIEIPFDETDMQILNVNISKNHDHIKIEQPIVCDNSIKFAFDFLEYRDQITITILHTANNTPSFLKGHVVGVSKEFINMSKRHDELMNALLEVMLDSNGFIIRFLNIIISNKK